MWGSVLGRVRCEKELEFELMRYRDARVVPKGYGRLDLPRSADAITVESTHVHSEPLVEGNGPDVVVGGGEPDSSTSAAAGVFDGPGHQGPPDTLTFDRGGDGDDFVLQPAL